MATLRLVAAFVLAACAAFVLAAAYAADFELGTLPDLVLASRPTLAPDMQKHIMSPIYMFHTTRELRRN